jgi:hypothetical protein
MREVFRSATVIADVRSKQKIPEFVPSWMLAPDRIFNPMRALRGAIRMGDNELATKLIESYGLNVDKAAILRQTALNRDLLRAVDNYDWYPEHTPNGPSAERVRNLLEQGASPNAAVWNGPKMEWFSAVSSAIIVAGSSAYKRTERHAAFEVAVQLFKKGAIGSFSNYDTGYENSLADEARRVAMGLPRDYEYRY